MFCFVSYLLLCIDVVVHFSLSIVYGVLAASNWIAPSVVFLLGPKWSLFAGGCTYWLVFFLEPRFLLSFSDFLMAYAIHDIMVSN